MRIIDLFSGCGGMSLGFQNAGYEILRAYDNWDPAIKCYSENFRHPIFEKDLADWEKIAQEIKPTRPDIIIGGPPCQDFSHAGQRIEGSRADLTISYARIVSVVAPKWFVMENVDRAQKSEAYNIACSILKTSGYGITQVTLNAAFCGVPQSRKRCFVIGLRGASPQFLEGILMQNQSKEMMTLRKFFGKKLDFEFYYRHPRNYNRRAVFSIDEPAPTMRGVNRPVPKGYPGHPNDATKVSKNMHVLSTHERALIQTFPSNFKFNGTKSANEQMIGNAVPVKLAEYVAKSILEYKGVKTDFEFIEFKNWLNKTYSLSERSVSDICSRLKRSLTYIDVLDSTLGVDDALYYLNQIEGFCDLSNSVRSQIRNSIKYAKAYQNVA